MPTSGILKGWRDFNITQCFTNSSVSTRQGYMIFVPFSVLSVSNTQEAVSVFSQNL